jgi:hypothetical protein
MRTFKFRAARLEDALEARRLLGSAAVNWRVLLHESVPDVEATFDAHYLTLDQELLEELQELSEKCLVRETLARRELYTGEPMKKDPPPSDVSLSEWFSTKRGPRVPVLIPLSEKREMKGEEES